MVVKMQISKSQLGNKKLESIIEDEKVEYCTFENEEYSNNLYDNEFEHCEFDNIILQSIQIQHNLQHLTSMTTNILRFCA